MTRVPEDADRDFTAGCMVVKDGKVLLINHEKLGMWLQPGGHIEDRETPDETAKRETLEETGIEVELHEDFLLEKSCSHEAYNLPRPFHVNVHRIKDGHWHCSMLYLARAKQQKEASHSHEHNGQRWFTKEDLRSGEYDMPEDTKNTALKAIEIVD